MKEQFLPKTTEVHDSYSGAARIVAAFLCWRRAAVETVSLMAAVFATLGLLAAWNIASAQSPSPSYPNINVAKPSTVLELLRNVRVVVQNGLLIRRDFYVADNLLRFLGGDQARLYQRTATTLAADLSGYDGFVPRIPSAPGTIEGMGVYLWRDPGQNGRVRAHLEIYLRGRTTVGFEEVVSLFGPEWSELPPLPPDAHRPYDPTTRPHGNARIEYKFPKAQLQQRLFAGFNGDASLAQLLLDAEQEP